MPKKTTWYVYILRCADASLYTGITTDVARRIHEHNAQGRLAAKYLRGRLPLTLVYQVAVPNKSAALKQEWNIKKLSKEQKEYLIASMSKN